MSCQYSTHHHINDPAKTVNIPASGRVVSRATATVRLCRLPRLCPVAMPEKSSAVGACCEQKYSTRLDPRERERERATQQASIRLEMLSMSAEDRLSPRSGERYPRPTCVVGKKRTALARFQGEPITVGELAPVSLHY